MERHTFDEFRALVYRVSGISLGDHKEVLLSTRIAKRMRVLGMTDYAGYLEHVLGDETGMELVHLVDVVSTNVTHFYRERDHFDHIEEKLLEWQAAGRTRFRMWSAACSTGEEPYSLAMTTLDASRTPALDVRILGTDISVSALAAARMGVYSVKKIAGLTPEDRLAHISRTRSGDYAVSDRVRSLVTFSQINLAAPPFVMRGPFDVIMCRNVMIYFDIDVRNRLISEMRRLLAPGGLLVLGHAESLAGMQTGLRSIGPSVYVSQ